MLAQPRWRFRDLNAYSFVHAVLTSQAAIERAIQPAKPVRAIAGERCNAL
jgi:hypothetical protein